MKKTKCRKATLAVLIILAALTNPIPLLGQHKAHSVLASGDWWKIAIPQTNIYKLTADALSISGGCPVSDIALYGSEGGLLNPTNGVLRTDDLEAIPIDIHDINNNGLFDGNDYIIFYATGAMRWKYSTETGYYMHNGNPYSLYNYVYLTVCQGSHPRVESDNTTTATNEVITTSITTELHESDKTNTHRTGQIWVGERFSHASSSRHFTIPLSGSPNGNIQVRIALASIASSTSRFSVTLNGNTHSYVFSSNNPYQTFQESVPANSSSLEVDIEYQSNDVTAIGYLDFIETVAEVTMQAGNSTRFFHTEQSDFQTHRYRITGANSGTKVWDVTNPNSVFAPLQNYGDGNVTFNATSDIRRSFAVFSENTCATPQSVTRIGNQDIHGAESPEMVIVCHPSLKSQAERLASLHSIHDGLTVLVVNQEQVFNEFSSGQTDPVAIREMLRMFHLRAQANQELREPRYLLLFGKGTYDNRDLMGLGVPTVVTPQSVTSFDDEGSSIATDDYFVYLDNGENGNGSGDMDVAVGRLPAKSIAEATHLVDKIEQYLTRSDLLMDNIRGDWRNYVALLADDADPGSRGDTAFTHSSEVIASRINSQYPQLNIDKIYADAYIQQSGADGSYYPDVNNALKKRMDYGCLLINYIGHGSSQYIGTERFMMKSNIANYANLRQLPFFITSTCTFGRYDIPDETCGAEEFLLSNGAGIGCLAASRPISHIEAVNTDMVMQALDPSNSIGDAIRIAKNNRYTTQALTLMGDPALRLSHPSHKVVVTAINGKPTDSTHCDTASVLSTVTIEGEIQNHLGEIVSDFEGTLYAEVFDRIRKAKTLANDNDGCEVEYAVQNSKLYKGSTAVRNGRFTYSFTVPRDVSFKYDRCKLSHYAKSATEDATGSYQDLYLGGFDESVNLHETRPQVELYINDTSFKTGGITDDSPTLLVHLFDSVGINAVGSGLGHDITAMLDGNVNSIIILNDLYDADINDERYGTVRYQLTSLSPGKHTVYVKAWNIFNYSGCDEISFIVHSSDTVTTTLRAYPNPSSTQAWIQMEHNGIENIEAAQADIYTMQGRRICTFNPPAMANSYVIGPVCWNLCDESGNRVPPGIYIVRFTIYTSEGNRITETGKIVISD